MILLGIDDTDMPGTLGTNQIARRIVAAATGWKCRYIVRHQLCTDSGIPCTSQNGSASIWLEPDGGSASELLHIAKTVLREHFVEGSDPGLCFIDRPVPLPIVDFAKLAQRAIVTQPMARELAARYSVHLEGLGGTEGGVIGALAAIGLAATQDDGRIVQLGVNCDDVRGVSTVAELQALGVTVVHHNTGALIADGVVELVKKLRPNMRAGKPVLFVTPTDSGWMAVKLR